MRKYIDKRYVLYYVIIAYIDTRMYNTI